MTHLCESAHRALSGHIEARCGPDLCVAGERRPGRCPAGRADDAARPRWPCPCRSALRAATGTERRQVKGSIMIRTTRKTLKRGGLAAAAMLLVSVAAGGGFAAAASTTSGGAVSAEQMVGLESLVTDYKTRPASRYTSDSWAPFVKALSTAAGVAAARRRPCRKSHPPNELRLERIEEPGSQYPLPDAEAPPPPGFVREHRRVDDMVHEESDRLAQCRQQHHPAESNRCRRTAQHRPPQRRRCLTFVRMHGDLPAARVARPCPW